MMNEVAKARQIPESFGKLLNNIHMLREAFDELDKKLIRELLRETIICLREKLYFA